LIQFRPLDIVEEDLGDEKLPIWRARNGNSEPWGIHSL